MEEMTEPSVLETPFTNPVMEAESPHGAIYLLRTAHQHHTQLTALADQKASILVGASSVILTLILARGPMAAMPVPLLVLGTTCVLAALLAIIAVVPAYHWKRRRIAEPNLLFFGSFAEMTEQDYLQRMQEVVRTEHNVYWAMTRDIYHLGKVLYTRKYRFVSYSYRVFAIGYSPSA